MIHKKRLLVLFILLLVGFWGFVAKENKSLANQVSGGIIPHHLFPSFILTDFFSRLSKQNPTTVILIGPNHYERGNYKALSSLHGWETPWGILEPNEEIIQALLKSKSVQVDEKVLAEDQSVAGIMPFIKHYLPKTKVVPILLSGFMTEEDTQLLADNLIKYLNKKTVIISAVDFSHGLTNQQAVEKDKITLSLMRDFNYKKLLSLNNEYLDSPPSIVVLLKTMQTLGATEMELLANTNSGQLQKNDSIETTSYFSMVYHIPYQNKLTSKIFSSRKTKFRY